MTVWVLGITTNALAQVDDTLLNPDENEVSAPRHRWDFSAIYVDHERTNEITGVFSYAYHLTPKSNIALDITYVESFMAGEG